MIQELLYTSHDGKGLKGRGGGYCTVLASEGMADGLVRVLEGLSFYDRPFDIHDLRSANNPVNYQHVIRRISGIRYHILSRVAAVSGEQTGAVIC